MTEKEVIEEFAKLLMSEVRDKTFEFAEKLLEGEYSTLTGCEFSEGFSNLEEQDKKNIRNQSRAVIDHTLFNLLSVLDEYNEKYMLVANSGSELYDLSPLTGGLSSRLYSKRGWFEKFSKFGEYPSGPAEMASTVKPKVCSGSYDSKDLDMLGQKLIKNVYDVTVASFDQNKSNEDISKNKKDSPSAGCNSKFEVDKVVTSTMFHFLNFIDTNYDGFDLVKFSGNEIISFKNTSHGLGGELFTEDGWIAKYSQCNVSK